MAKKKMIETFDLLLKDLLNTNVIFGGKVVVFENMHAKTNPTFCEYLMRIGNRKELLTSENKIEISNSFIVPYTTEQESLNALFETTFPNMHDFLCDASSVASCVILTMKHDFVNEINDMLIAKFSKEAKTFVAIDEICVSNDQSEYEDFLHSLNPDGLPPYILTLKENCPIILL
ncbi:uncharacterized protein LOC142174456 [Nicotiana tabacum]|uniref:Uncharacterized protein LOC142174456 n=1 Tax=Nicotiana tabacum TaxID=4097 RepID=A0AC58TGK4_TOBAC